MESSIPDIPGVDESSFMLDPAESGITNLVGLDQLARVIQEDLQSRKTHTEHRYHCGLLSVLFGFFLVMLALALYDHAHQPGHGMTTTKAITNEQSIGELQRRITKVEDKIELSEANAVSIEAIKRDVSVIKQEDIPTNTTP